MVIGPVLHRRTEGIPGDVRVPGSAVRVEVATDEHVAIRGPRSRREPLTTAVTVLGLGPFVRAPALGRHVEVNEGLSPPAATQFDRYTVSGVVISGGHVVGREFKVGEASSDEGGDSSTSPYTVLAVLPGNVVSWDHKGVAL